MVDGKVDGTAVGLIEGIKLDGFVEGLKDGFEDGDIVGEMKSVSVTQSAGLEQNFSVALPLQTPLQQLPPTNRNKNRARKSNFRI